MEKWGTLRTYLLNPVELFFKPTPAKYGPFVPSGSISCNITGGGAAVNCNKVGPNKVL